MHNCNSCPLLARYYRIFIPVFLRNFTSVKCHLLTFVPQKLRRRQVDHQLVHDFKIVKKLQWINHRIGVEVSA